MKKVVFALVILLIMIFVSYYFEDITGQSTVLDQIKGTKPYSETQIIIDPVEANAGQVIKVTIIPGSDGAKREMTIHSENGINKDSTSEWCNLGWTRQEQLAGAESFKCTMEKTFNYRIPSSFVPGDYYIRLYDYAKAKENNCASKHGKEYETCVNAIAWFTVLA